MPRNSAMQRLSPLVSREAAQAIDESALVASEPMTVVLSQKGWIRAGKGHELDPGALSYREGDALLDFSARAQHAATPRCWIQHRAQLLLPDAQPAVRARQRRTAERPVQSALRAAAQFVGLASAAIRAQKFIVASAVSATASSPHSRTFLSRQESRQAADQRRRKSRQHPAAPAAVHDMAT